MTDTYLTVKEIKPLLRERLREAGSQNKLAGGDRSKQSVISAVLAGRRPPTGKAILDILGLEIVLREKGPKRWMANGAKLSPDTRRKHQPHR